MNGYRLARAILWRLDPETAHDLTLWLLRRGLGPVARMPDDPILATRVWGRDNLWRQARYNRVLLS